jgi:hypothetical protein
VVVAEHEPVLMVVGERERSRTERVWRVVVRAHDPDAIANQASRSSDIVEVETIALVHRTSATNTARARSASARLPCTVALR